MDPAVVGNAKERSCRYGRQCLIISAMDVSQRAAVAAAVTEAIDLAGGQSALAKALGVTVPTVSQWRNGQRPVPIGRAAQIEVLTGVAATRTCPGEDWAHLKVVRPKRIRGKRAG